MGQRDEKRQGDKETLLTLPALHSSKVFDGSFQIGRDSLSFPPSCVCACACVALQSCGSKVNRKFTHVAKKKKRSCRNREIEKHNFAHNEKN